MPAEIGLTGRHFFVDLSPFLVSALADDVELVGLSDFVSDFESVFESAFPSAGALSASARFLYDSLR